MKSLIVPTNFSEASTNAANYATDMAVAIHADLLLLNIIQMPGSFDVPLTEYEYDGMMQNAEEGLAALKKKLLLRTENKISISTTAVLGSMRLEIEAACEIKKPFIVIIGTEDKSFTQRLLFGSNTFSIIKNLHYPVLVVPQKAFFRYIKRIGLAADFKNIYDVPVETIRELVEMFDASLDIIHVSNSKEEEIKNRVAFSLLKERLREFDPETHFIINDDIEQAVNDYAAQNHKDLLMVIPRQHDFFESLVHKSESRKIALRPSVPVLAVAE